MPQYLVEWAINIDAETPEDAAIQARKYQAPSVRLQTFTVTSEQVRNRFLDPVTVTLDNGEIVKDGS